VATRNKSSSSGGMEGPVVATICPRLGASVQVRAGGGKGTPILRKFFLAWKSVEMNGHGHVAALAGLSAMVVMKTDARAKLMINLTLNICVMIFTF